MAGLNFTETEAAQEAADTAPRQSFLSFVFAPENPRGLWIRYISAVALMVFAVCVTHFAPLSLVADVRENAAVINISGKQRMLSQRILFLASQTSASPEKHALYAETLEETALTFARGHKALRFGGDLGISAALPEALEPLYTTPRDGVTLDNRIERFVKDAILIAQAAPADDTQPALDRLIASGLNVQLSQLDDAVSAYQLYTQNKIDRVRRVGLMGFILALSVLALESLLIFLPAHRSINRALDTADAYAFRLEQNNKDLNHFAYIASHDLMAPLRGMTNLVTWIEEEIPDNTSPEVLEYIALLNTRIDRMEALLKDILNFSRAGKVAEDPVDVDVNLLLDEVVSWVKCPEGFTIHVAPNMPTVFAPRTILQQCFLNLISNGIKHHDRNQGQVTVAYEDSKDSHIFSVEDDGPGIPAEYHAYVFEMFNRLKPRDEVEGSGIGLSIIKRMITSVGGTIQVDAVPVDTGRGTRFVLSLPKNIKL